MRKSCGVRIHTKLTDILDPVFLCNDIGSNQSATSPGPGMLIAEDGRYSMSVKEAVRVAQSNNFMGLICTKNILVRSSPVY